MFLPPLCPAAPKVERVKPDYPVNARQDSSGGPVATRADYPVQSNKQARSLPDLARVKYAQSILMVAH